MSGFYCTLGHRVWHQEEVKCAIDDFGLLHESVVNVSTLWRIKNCGISTSYLEESLSYSLVNDNESVLWVLLFLVRLKTIFLLDNLLKLLQFMFYYLLSHGITNTVTINENVIRK
jgi:hypothetical protein